MTIESWQHQIKEAAARSQRLTIRGSGSKSFLAPDAQGEVLDTRTQAGIATVLCSRRIATQKRREGQGK